MFKSSSAFFKNKVRDLNFVVRDAIDRLPQNMTGFRKMDLGLPITNCSKPAKCEQKSKTSDFTGYVFNPKAGWSKTTVISVRCRNKNGEQSSESKNAVPTDFDTPKP